MADYFVAPWLAQEIKAYYQLHGLPTTPQQVEACNQYFYRQHPQTSQRTLRKATQAVRQNRYRTELSSPHYTAMPTTGIVPLKYSQYDEYIEQMRELLRRCQKEQRPLRLMNIQDGHKEQSDPALWDLVLLIMQDFNPDYVPIMADMVDNTLLAPKMHGTSYYQVSVDLPSTFDESSSTSRAMIAFEEATLDWLNAINQVTGPETIKPAWLGNHEIWLLRYLHDNPEASGYFFKHFFERLRTAGGLWVEGDTRKELPVTNNVIAVHGWTVKGGNYGSTANGYLQQYGNHLSVFAGHTHRQETVWGKPHPYTGGRNFVNVCGTLATLRPAYRQHAYTGHNYGFTLAYLAPSGNVGHHLVDVMIYRVNDWYEARVGTSLYRMKATVAEDYGNPL
jgi:hypothetical protein